ncbi:DUF4838 domain-containing protein [Paenibacillus eucommiae]|uniref:SLH domain-containing protein n=1 Tax=Paenibacillus eucommiae TaxID=1355755 RepID=A0ABS4IVW0_9BACL|nr:DUF4838 domain-containing protein [Paenibacillus eucommiae]MBP1991710.1 hypothetical protein [Paenibacillus eucommiae]
MSLVSKQSKKVILLFIMCCLIYSTFGSFIVPVTGAAAAESNNPLSSLAMLSDVKNHWAKETIQAWVESGYVEGYPDGTFQPDRPINRGEAIALINRSFGYHDKASVDFADLPASDWAYDEVAKAVQAGYIEGYLDGTIGTKREISRQEAAVLLVRLLGLNADGESASAVIFADDEKLPEWSKGAVAAAAAAKLVEGYGDGQFRPQAAITRAELLVVLDRALKSDTALEFSQAGTYGPGSGIRYVSGNVIVNAAGVTLQNMRIAGNVILAKGIEEGDVYLHNVTVLGTTTVQGGGKNSIHVKNSVLATVIVDKKQGTVRIVVEGTTKIAEVLLKTPAIIEQSGSPDNAAGISQVKLHETIAEGSQITLRGYFDKVHIAAKGIVVEFQQGVIHEFIAAGQATNLKLDIGVEARILAMSIDAIIKVLGGGVIEKATLSDKARGTTFEKQPLLMEGAGKEGTHSFFSPGTGGDNGNGGEGGSAVRLANDGQALYKVFVHSDANIMEKHAAEELVNYLNEVTGATFQLTESANPPSGPVVLVGRNTLTDSLVPELTDESLGEDGFVIQKEQQYIVIAGSHSRGTMYGVNYFLDDYVGVKWYSPIYTFVPSHTTLQLDINKDIQVPRYEYREMYVNDGNNELYRAHNLLNGKYRDHYGRIPQSEPWLDSWSDFWPSDVHNFHEIVPQTEYHNGGQLLAMDENVREIAATNLIDLINQRKNEGKNASYGFSQQDEPVWYADADSKSFAEQHGGTLAAPIFDMVSDVAARVKAEIPEARIGTLAYMFTEKAPTNVTIPDNVVITFAPIFKNHGRPIFDPENQFSGDNAKEWADISQNIIIWDYLINYGSGGYLTPYPSLYAMSETIQSLAQYPAFKGYFGQHMHGITAPASTGLNDLRAWIGARLLWNPNQDYRQLIEQFVAGYYGDAAPYISQYIELLHEAFEQSDSLLSTSTSLESSYLSFDVMRQADKWFAQAEAAVADSPDFLNHVQRTRVEVDYVILMRGADYMKEAQARNIAWNLDFNNRFTRFKEFTAGIKHYKINGTMESLYDQIFERTVSATPDFVADLPKADWREYQDYALQLYSPVGTKMVQDPKASDSAAARVTGSTNAWAIQLPNLNLPREGKWTLYANVRIDPGTGTAGDTAFRYGISHPTKGVSASMDYAQVADGEYHWVALPGLYEYDPEDISDHFAWLAPTDSTVIQNLYVDQIIAVKFQRTVPAAPDFVANLPESDWREYQDDVLQLSSPVGTGIAQDLKASDHAAAKVTGSTNAWAIQLPNQSLPNEGQWKLYANVRIDPGTGTAGDTALKFGIYHPALATSAAMDYAQMADGEYHWVEFPGTYQYDPEQESDHFAWLAPPNSTAIQNLYVDRIVAVKNSTIPDFVAALPESDWKEYQDDALHLSSSAGTLVVPDARASNHKAARVTGSTNAWAIQLPNQSLPNEGKWKLYANVRIDPGTGTAGDTAFKFGIYHPTLATSATMDYAQMADGEYHWVEFPGTYQYDPEEESDDHLAWIAPPNSTAIQNLYVDRIIAVKISTIPDFVADLPESDWKEYQDDALQLYSPAEIARDPKASDTVAVKVTGSTNAWAIQLPSLNLPNEGHWKLYASVRIDPGTGSAGDTAFRYGIYHPTMASSALMDYAQVADGEYHWVEFPEIYQYDAEALSDHFAWLVPPDSTAIQNLYVDRFILVRQ